MLEFLFKIEILLVIKRNHNVMLFRKLKNISENLFHSVKCKNRRRKHARRRQMATFCLLFFRCASKRHFSMPLKSKYSFVTIHMAQNGKERFCKLTRV